MAERGAGMDIRVPILAAGRVKITGDKMLNINNNYFKEEIL